MPRPRRTRKFGSDSTDGMLNLPMITSTGFLGLRRGTRARRVLALVAEGGDHGERKLFNPGGGPLGILGGLSGPDRLPDPPAPGRVLPAGAAPRRPRGDPGRAARAAQGVAAAVRDRAA